MPITRFAFLKGCEKPFRVFIGNAAVRILFGVLCLFFVQPSFAQNINTPANFPDPNFRTAIEAFMETTSFTAVQAAQRTNGLNVSSLNISDLTGIEYFTNISVLFCDNNQLTSLDVSSNTALERLYCYNNNLTSITLSSKPSLRWLYLYNNSLPSIDLTGCTALEYLYAQYNQLSALDVSNSPSIRVIRCFRNQIASLTLGASLNLTNIRAFNNNLADLTSIINSQGMNAGSYLNVSYNDLGADDWQDVETLSVRIGAGFIHSPQSDGYVFLPGQNLNSAANFPDPAFKAAAEQLIGVASGTPFTAQDAEAITGVFDCAGQGISSASGIEYFTNITSLICNDNQLTTLDVSANTALQKLYCYNNNLTSLTVSNNPNLRWLYSYNNSLTSLDLSSLAALEYLYTQDNQLTSLDVSNSPLIQVVRCFRNQIASLALGASPNLNSIRVFNNNLTDLTSFIDSQGMNVGSYLNVTYNDLGADDWQDVDALSARIGAGFIHSPQNDGFVFVPGQNINIAANFPDPAFKAAAEQLIGVASGTPFTAQDAEAITGVFDCAGQGISSASGIEYFTNITSLICNDNQLTTLDVSANTALQKLYCYNNNLTSLTVSNNPNLRWLYSYNNSLTSLDLSSLAALEYLYTQDNQLTSLDVSNSPLIQVVRCFRNQIASLALGASPNLNSIRAFNNYLTDISSMTNSQGLAPGSYVNIIQNLLSEDDLVDIQVLEQRLGSNFIYTINDTLPPVLAPPSGIAIEATSANGAVATYSSPSVSDILDPSPTVVCSPGSGSLFPLGETIVSCTATDSAGNTSSGTFSVVVIDTTPPDMTCPGSQAIEATGPNGAVVTYSQPTVVDIADLSPTVISEPASGSVFGLGDTVVDCTAVDASGNVSSCSFVIAVVDTTPPDIVVQADLTIEAQDSSGAVVNYLAPSVSDIVDLTPSVTCWPASGSVFPLGDTVVSCTATDSSGNVSNSTFTVTVTDTTAPDITCPADLMVEAQDSNGAVVTYSSPVVSDGVGSNPTVICEPASGSVFAIGSTVVNCTAIDSSGNVSNCSFTIQVIDTTPPTIDCPADVLAEAQSTSGAVVVFSSPTALDLVDANPLVFTTPLSGSTFSLGSTIVHATAIDSSNNISTCQFVVEVTDTTAPQLDSCPDNILVEGTSPLGNTVLFTLPSSVDLVDASPVVYSVPQSGAVFPIGATVVTVYTNDFSQNVSSCTFIVEVTDTTPPVIAASGPESVTLECGQSVYDPQIWQASVSDLCDPNVQLVYQGDSVDVSQLGAYVIEIAATDVYGNAAVSVTRTVVVQDTLPPVINGANDLVVDQSPACDTLTSVPLSVSVADLCDPAPTITTTIYYADGTSIVRNGLPYVQEVFPIGVNVITVQAVDGSQNQSEENFFITVLSNTQLQVSVFDFDSGVAQPVSNALVKVFDSTNNSCADLIDGTQGNGVPSSWYNALFFGGSCSPDYDGSTNSAGSLSLPVYPGEYVVLAVFDTDNSGTIDSSDEVSGEPVFNLACGESRSVILKRQPFSLFALHSMNLGWLTNVEGDVATQSSSQSPLAGGAHEIYVNGYSTINGTVCADSLYLGSRTRINGDVVYNNLDHSSSVTINGNQVSTLNLPLSDPAPSLPSFSEGSFDITVAGQETQVLAAGTYGNLTLESGSNSSNTVVQLNSGAYTFADVNIGSYAKLEFLGPCEIRIKDRLYVGYRSSIVPADGFGLTANDALIIIEGQNGASGEMSDSPRAMETNSYCTIQSRICAVNGTVSVGYRSMQTGSIVSKWIYTNTRSTFSR